MSSPFAVSVICTDFVEASMWLLGIEVLSGQVVFYGEVSREIEFVYVITLFSLVEIMG